MATLYENIKARRLELQMSQEQLAKLTGYSDRTSISKIEAGKVDLSQSKIKLFAAALQTTPAQLMGWEERANVVFSKPSAEQIANFAKNLQIILILNKMTQSELAAKLGVSETTVAGWCSGLVLPNWETIDRLSKLLRFPVDGFFFATPPTVSKLNVQEAPDLVREFLQLDEGDQKEVMRYIRFLRNADKYRNRSTSEED